MIIRVNVCEVNHVIIENILKILSDKLVRKLMKTQNCHRKSGDQLTV